MDMDLNEDYSQQQVVTKPADSNPRSTKRAKKCASSEVNINSTPTVKEQTNHSLIFAEGGLPDRTPVVYISNGKALEGYKQGHGIFCFCCKTVISASKFEAHAGRSARRKPYENIRIKGVSLHDYASSLKPTGKHTIMKNDDKCAACQKGGALLFCERCPRSFHLECIPEKTALLQKWFCKYCQDSMKCLEGTSSDAAIGTVPGISPFEQVEKSCIRDINSDKNELVACALCRSCKFSEEGFNDQTVIVCDQCELEFHIGCLREHYKADLKALPSGSWYCSVECGRLNYALKILVTCGAHKVPDSLVGNIPNPNVNWIIVRGKHVSEEDKLLLSEAVDIMHGGFDPIIDKTSKRDMIEEMTYGQRMDALDFGGVHCAMLTMGSKVIVAALFRVFGHEIAELPIVATSQQYRRKGYFKLFFTCFEKLLSFLKIKKLVLPASKQAKTMWTDRFGFRKVTPLEKREYRQRQTSMVQFRGTCLLEKVVPESKVTFEDGTLFSLSMG